MTARAPGAVRSALRSGCRVPNVRWSAVPEFLQVRLGALGGTRTPNLLIRSPARSGSGLVCDCAGFINRQVNR